MEIDRRELLAASAACGLATGVPAIGKSPIALPDRIAPRAIAADLAVVREAYGLLHPGLTRYLPAGGFDRLIAQATNWADRERSPADAYLMLARLTAAVRCGHTHANPANQKTAVQRSLLGRPDRLPFCTRLIDGRMIVTDPLSSGLERGAEILAIDGASVRQLVRDMLPLTRADGHNDAKRIAQLELHRGDRFAAFDVLRPLLRPSRSTGSVDLAVRSPDGRERRISLATAPEGARGTAAKDDPQFGWRFKIGGDGVGLLTMPDWSLYNSKWDWKAFLAGVLDALIADRARGLVIDLRENEGGIDCGDELVAGLVDRPVEPPPERRLIRFRETPMALRPVLDTWDPSFHTLGADAKPAVDRPGYFDLGAGDGAAIAPGQRRFRGKVAVLIGPTCSSATFRFADLVQRNRLATLVGEPTGGNRRGINGGRYFFVRLPETGFEVDLPLIGYFPLSRQPDRGLDPDILVRPRLADVVAGVDRALAAAVKVVRG